MGAIMYTQDYDEILPFFATYMSHTFQWPVGPYNIARMHWTGAVYPYVKNAQIFVCPSRGSDWCGYGYNMNLGYWGN
jgi:hypothetical protein